MATIGPARPAEPTRPGRRPLPPGDSPPVLATFARLVVLAMLCALFFPGEGACQERPALLHAERVLPKTMLSGPGFRVDPQVGCDGYMNIYLLHSRYGDFRVVSTALLSARIGEVLAMQAMDRMNTSKEFMASVGEGGMNVLQGAVDLVTKPVETLGGAVSGVGKMFNRAGESLFGSKASKYEDPAIQGFLGYSTVKREYALAFGVDPYSTNAVLAAHLERVASAGYAGGLSASALKVMIPGGVGVAVSAVGGARWLGEVDLAQSPADLRRANRQKLIAMGLAAGLAAEFIDNGEFTPSQQSLLVAALDTMPGVAGRDRFIRLACGTSDQDVALFRQRMAQCYAGYHRHVEKIERFLALGELVGARSVSGKLVVILPLDSLFWTASIAKTAQGVRRDAVELGLNTAEFWVSGQVSPLARSKIQAMGWMIREKGDVVLLR